ncbi:MAG: DnaJ domain-containing protein [Gemmataceae bacterium]
MARDLYEILGVSRTASDDEITKAYRKLARQHHPDRNPGDKQAESRFKEIQNAYDVLSDKAKRANYDRFGSASGPNPGFGGAGGGFSGFSGGGVPPDIEDILRQFGMGGAPGGFSFESFGGAPRGRSRRREPPPSEEMEQEITIPFLVAARGDKIDLNIDGTPVGVTIPAGAKDGQAIRLKGILPNGGNLKLKLHVEPHPQFRREGDDLLVEVPISVAEAILGGKIDAPTLSGETVVVSVPPGTSSGARLRLRGKGIAGGNLFVIVKVMVPKGVDGRGRELIEEFARLYPQNPRHG